MPYYIEIPDFASLSNEQRRAVRHAGSVRLKGGPGTGKSLVSMWRALGDESGNHVLILTYTLSLEFYFHQMLASARRKGSTKNITIQRSQKSYYNEGRMLSQHYHEIILDEAQDMTRSELLLFVQKANQISFGADYGQQLYPGKGAKEDELEQILPVSRMFEMNRNYRSTKQILKAVREFFPERSLPADIIERSKDGALVELYVSGFREEVDATYNLLEEWIPKTNGNIGVLVPSISKVTEVFNAVKELLPNDTTEYTSDNQSDRLTEMGRLHICTYKSSKGLEWDVVVLPFFGGRDWWIDNTKVKENDHYVAMTRAKNQLLLVSSNHSDKSTLSRAYANGPVKSAPKYTPPSNSIFDDDDDDMLDLAIFPELS